MSNLIESKEEKEIKEETKMDNIESFINEQEKQLEQVTKEVKPVMSLNDMMLSTGSQYGNEDNLPFPQGMVELTKKQKTVNYLFKGNSRIQDTLNWNAKLEWSEDELAIYKEIADKSIELGEHINALTIKIQMTDINKQLESTPVANVKVEFSNNNGFLVRNTKTGAIVTTGTASEIIKFLEGYALMQ